MKYVVIKTQYTPIDITSLVDEIINGFECCEDTYEWVDHGYNNGVPWIYVESKLLDSLEEAEALVSKLFDEEYKRLKKEFGDIDGWRICNDGYTTIFLDNLFKDVPEASEKWICRFSVLKIEE